MFLKKLKNLIKSSDLFQSNEMLRYENELEYKSLTGGVLSLALIVTIIIGFANMIILTMQRETIFSTKEIVKHSDPPFMIVEVSPENKFMMGIQVYGVNLSSPGRYFDYRFEQLASVGGEIISVKNIPLIQCTKEHWAQLPQVVANFQNLRISNWLCPQIGFDLKLKGKYSSPSSNQYIFTLKKCIHSSTVTCVSQQQISQLFSDNSNQFYLTYFYINSIINQNNKDFISYYLQDSNYAFFGDEIGAQSYIYLSDYTVSTDYSIWPFEKVEEVTGCFVQRTLISRPTQVSYEGVYNGQYAYIRIDKATSSVRYRREVQKISTVFSFIGGMVSAISAILFIIKAYNSQAFQIQIASALFTNSSQHQQLVKNNFFSYVKYNVQKLLRSIGYQSHNEKFIMLQNCLSEMQKQLDVKNLIQWIIFLQHCLEFVFEDYQLQLIQMKKPTTYQQIKKVRLRCLQQQNKISEQTSILENCQRISPVVSFLQMHHSNIKIIVQDQKRSQKKQKVNFSSYMDHIVLDDIPSVTSQRQIRKANKFESIHTVLNKKKSTLLALEQNARKGDRISSKIYNHLYNKSPQTFFKQCSQK